MCNSIAFPYLFVALAVPTVEDRKSSLLEVGRIEPVIVRLRVQPFATLEDETWLTLEFENTSQHSIEVRNAHYRIESDRFDAKSRDPVGSGSLASGNTYDLFPKAWEKSPVLVALEPGIYQVSTHPSNYTAALLGVPPPKGLFVEARLHLTLDVAGEPSFSTPADGVPFSFEWRRGGPSEPEVLQKRLRQLMREQKLDWGSRYLLQLLLATPEVSETLMSQELLERIREFEHDQGRRELLVKPLSERFSNEPNVLAYYLKNIKDGHRSSIYDLIYEPRLWHDSFIEPLLSYYEQSPSPSDTPLALYLLSQHRADWPDALNVPTRLSRRVLDQFPLLKKGPSELENDELQGWTMTAGILGQTHDPSVVPLLVPYLELRTQIVEPRETCGTGAVLGQPPPLRISDIALETLLILRGEDPKAVYDKVRGNRGSLARVRFASLDEWIQETNRTRDKLIDALKQELAIKESKDAP